MNFKQLMLAFRDEFDAVFTEFLQSLKPSANRAGPSAVSAWQAITDFSLQGGKRLRPLLMSLAYEGYGGQNRREILKASCSIELMQSFLLIHDDIIDRADLRRGAPTVHKRFEEEYRVSHAPDLSHLGTSLALLTGNLAMAYGAWAISRSRFAASRRAQVLDIYMDIVADENYGQILDMRAEMGQQLTEQDVLLIFYYKTTRYSVEGPLHMGATLAGAARSELDSLSLFADPLGNAFQLQDDILGLFGDEAKVGKSVGSDLREGKQTLLVLKAFEWAGLEERSIITQCLGNPNITSREVNQVRSIVEASGSLAYAKKLIKDWVIEAQSALQRCSLSPETKQTLVEFADYLVEREY